MIRLSVDDLTYDESLRGGQVEIQYDDTIYRGEIRGIIQADSEFLIKCSWGAKYDVATRTWIADEWRQELVFTKAAISIMARDDRKRIIITGRNFLVATIFPKGGEALDPKDVKGLDLNHMPKPRIEMVVVPK